MGVIDELLANNEAFAARVEEAHLPVEPSRHLAIVTCRDSRLDVFAALGLTDVEADVRQSILRVRRSGFLPHRDSVRGFVYDVDTHALREVTAEEPGAGPESERD